MKRAAALTALVAYVLNVGCSSIREVPMAEVQSSEKVAAAVLRSGEVVTFDERGGIVNSYRGTIDGSTIQGNAVSIRLDQVTAIRAPRTNTAKTVLWVVVIAGVVVGAVAIIIHNASSSGSIFGWPDSYP